MQSTKRKAAAAALITVAAIAIGTLAGGAASSTQAGVSTSPGTRVLASLNMTGPRR